MQNELYHYGKLGMRWGQHIYKDRYGALKPSGRLRVKKLESEHDKLLKIGSITKKGEKYKADIEQEYQHLTGKPIGSRKELKRIQDMTNEELTAYNIRKQLESQANSNQPKPTVTIPTNKKLEDMTNDELKAYNDRKALENTYLGYQPKPRVSRGKRFAKAFGTKVLVPSAIATGRVVANKMLDGIKLDAKQITKEVINDVAKASIGKKK